MRAKVLNEAPERTIALIFDSGDEPVSLIETFATAHGLSASRISAIGAFERATLGYFDWQRKDYERIDVNQQVEGLSLLGDIALADGKPKVHLHAVLGKRDGTTIGGHLLEARVRPTLEVMLIESPSYLKKEHDAETGLALIRIGADR